MAIFNSYVKSPEGILLDDWLFVRMIFVFFIRRFHDSRALTPIRFHLDHGVIHSRLDLKS